MLATAANGNQPSQTIKVTYTDQSTSTFTQGFSDWYTPQNYSGESEAVSVAYNDTYTGGRSNNTYHLYGYSFALNSSKTVQSVTLPNDTYVNVLAMTLAGQVQSGPQQVSLSSAYNRTGMYTDGTTFSSTGGDDLHGMAYSATLLGSSQTWNSVLFNLGPANSSNDVSGAGQAVTLPSGNFSTLRMLATAANGNQPSQTIKVTYTDQSTLTFTQGFSDWYTPQNYSGESEAVSVAYNDTYNGGRSNQTYHLYGYSFALNSSKTVQSVTLPNDTYVNVLAMTLVP